MRNFNLNVNGVVMVCYEEDFYRCNIQDISEEHFSINVPVKNKEFLMLDAGEELDFEYLTESGSYYSFSAEILGREIIDKISMYKLSAPSGVTKIQRRNYVRVPVIREIQYRKAEEDSWNDGIVLDLSGGGMRFKSKDEFKLDEKLLVKIKTGSSEFEVFAEVKRSEKVSFDEYVYGLEFIEIDENKRDKIVQEVFLVMRKQRETI